MKWSILIFCALLLCGTQALIIPEELPSILSIIYSNIPPIRNGFDTRFGVGFRLGQHADVQLVTEIGPQIETQPLGEPERRRHAPASQYVEPKPRNQKQKQAALLERQETLRQETVERQPQLTMWTQQDPASAPQPDTWLAKWHKSIIQSKFEPEVDLDINSKVTTEVDEPVMSHLKKLYKTQQQ